MINKEKREKKSSKSLSESREFFQTEEIKFILLYQLEKIAIFKVPFVNTTLKVHT